MGRYYNGDIEGKFWFAVQSSNSPERFGCREESDIIHYYVDEDSIDEINSELAKIKNKLGENMEKFDEFFKNNSGYNSQMLKDNGLNESLLRDYADYFLGVKIRDCVLENGSCSFTAEC